MQVPINALLCKSDKGRHVYVHAARVATPNYVMRGWKQLQMHGFPIVRCLVAIYFSSSEVS